MLKVSRASFRASHLAMPMYSHVPVNMSGLISVGYDCFCISFVQICFTLYVQKQLYLGKICDFWPISCCISVTMRDRAWVTINH